MLAVLALFGGVGRPQVVAADDGTTTALRDPLAVAAAYATALEAGDAAGLAVTLSEDVALGDHFCCPIHPTKAQFVETLPRSWASGLRPHFVVGPAAGNTVTLRMLNNYAWEWPAGVAPLEIVYTLVVQNGVIVHGEGSVDPASEQRREASWVRISAALASTAQATPTASVGLDTQARGTRSIGPWLAAAALAIAGTIVVTTIQRRPPAAG